MDFHFVLLSDYDFFPFLDLDRFIFLILQNIIFFPFRVLIVFCFHFWKDYDPFSFSDFDRFSFPLVKRLWSFTHFGSWLFFVFCFFLLLFKFLEFMFYFESLSNVLFSFSFFLWSSKYDKKFLGSKFYSHFVWDLTSKIFRCWKTCILFKYICRVMWLRKIIKSNIYLDG